MPFDTFCLALKKIQKVQNTTFCLHFVETKDKQKAHFCERQKKTNSVFPPCTKYDQRLPFGKTKR